MSWYGFLTGIVIFVYVVSVVDDVGDLHGEDLQELCKFLALEYLGLVRKFQLFLHDMDDAIS